MIEMFLNYLLLNVPEGIIVTLLAFRGYSFKNNKKDYICAVIYSSLIIYIVPEILNTGMSYFIIMEIMLFILYYFGYNISKAKVLLSIFGMLIITGMAQIPLLFVLKNTIGIDYYFSLDIVKRFALMIPSRGIEIILLIIILKGRFKMKKVWLLGKSTRRNRGEKA